ncbi:uncharacterized protein Z520_11593 [Fonsecaea multimorphosa CBS 102226]|uniref:Uncharacterized protein n=1 Tax=Fonsecaea multimorphosa CBS 102226 TaxID=1442371 RepID=A0A0D2I672_9EURO|nr:uncharacterized protein Z520_11593 [Fonsecaea multimorphosa CBS 102226]KIX92741.1 hypothetical protein Z520_11593 [Fonsecaea multimorphosa CBS 102226]
MSPGQQNRGSRNSGNRPSSSVGWNQGVKQETDTIRPGGYGNDAYSGFDKTGERPNRQGDNSRKKSFRERIKDKWNKLKGSIGSNRTNKMGKESRQQRA